MPGCVTSEGRLTEIDANSVDLILLALPNFDTRGNRISPHSYVGWMSSVAPALERVLNPSGSFVLIGKEHLKDGERETYLIEIILALKERGWLWTDEYTWCKTDRHLDAFERCFHFTRNRDFFMNQNLVMVDMGSWKDKRLKNLSDNDCTRQKSKVGNSFSKNVSNWKGRDKAYPSNVISLPTDGDRIPEGLSTWFIKLFSPRDGRVLDPGVNLRSSAAAASNNLERDFIGVSYPAL